MKPYWIGLLALLVWVASVGSAGASGIDALIQDLRTGDEATRIRAVVALGNSADPQAVEALHEALHDESRLVRQYALHALKELLEILERTSRLVTRWLHDLVDRLEQQLEEPQTTAAKHPF